MSITFHFKTELPPTRKSNKGKNVCAICGYRVNDSKDEKRAMLSFPQPDAIHYPQWLNLISDHHLVSPYSRVCADHFNPDDFANPVKHGDKWSHRLKRGVVPSLLLPKKPKTSSPVDPVSRRRKRNEPPAEGVTSQTKPTRAPLQPPSNASSNPPLTQSVRHPAVPQHRAITFPVKEIFCPLCGVWKEEPCWSHTSTVADQAVLPYAVASLPQALYLGTSTDVSQVKAIFAKIHLPAQTVFGPLVGALNSPTEDGYRYALKDEMDGHIRQFDLENDKLSNWMKFVRFAENVKEQNVAVYFRDTQLFFVTTRRIQLKEELKVGYSSKYASIFGFVSDAAPTEIENCISETNTNRFVAIRTMTAQALDNYRLMESCLPECLPISDVPAVIPIGDSAIPYRQEENSHFRHSVGNVQTQPNRTANGSFSPGDAVFERNCAILQDNFLQVHPNSLPPSVAPPLPTPMLVHLLRINTVPCPAYPEPATVFPVTDTATDSDPALVDSPPAGVEKPQVRAKKRYVQAKPPAFKCDLCDKGLTAQTTHQHMWLCHRDYCSEQWKYQCSVCSERWPTNGALRGHMTRIHPPPVPVFSHDPQAIQDAIEHVRTTGYLTYYCGSCQRHFLNKSIFDIHKLRHRVKNPLDRPERSCPCCSHIAESFDDLMEHSVTHSQDGDSRLCIFCGQRAKSLRDHMMEHHLEIMEEATKDWKFDCDECGHRFFRENLLQLHKKTHNHTTSGYQCLYCAKVVYNVVEFGTHVREHKTNGVFKCTCCERTFPKYPFMRLHYRDMHDIKSMKTCVICQEVFRNPQKLKLHMDKVHVIDNREEEPVRKMKRSKKVRSSPEIEDDTSVSESEDDEAYPKRIQKKKQKRSTLKS